VTVESTAAQKPRRSAGTKSAASTGTTGTKRAAGTGAKRAGVKKSPGADPELIQLLTPEGKRVKRPDGRPLLRVSTPSTNSSPLITNKARQLTTPPHLAASPDTSGAIRPPSAASPEPREGSDYRPPPVHLSV